MLTVKHTFKLYDVVNKHFKSEEDSRTFVSEIEEIMDNKVDLKMNDFATRKDLNEQYLVLKQDILAFKTELEGDISALRTEVKEEISSLRTEVKEDISSLRTEVKEEISALRFDFNKLESNVNLSLANSALLLERTQKEQLKWLVGAMVAMLTLAVAVIKLT